MARSLAHIRSNASYELVRYRSRLTGTRYDVAGPGWRNHVKKHARRQERRFVATMDLLADDHATFDDEAWDQAQLDAAYEAELWAAIDTLDDHLAERIETLACIAYERRVA